MPTVSRFDQRAADQLRPLRIRRDFQIHPAGSVLFECGATRVICAVTIADGVPRWMREQNIPGGWLTGEYQMLPTATAQRTQRESTRTGPSGRSQEIQRLIGRSLRAVMDLGKIGARTIQVDCDVIDADGGTRCASVTGACVALELALRKLFLAGNLSEWPLRERVAAVSVGIVNGEALLDLCYAEDAEAEVDMNVVMTAGGRFIEVQGTAEKAPFSQAQMDRMLSLARQGLAQLFEAQTKALD
ncbi:MAG: Ribonuclease PH [Lentisphaerae bacterium ADurb.BinA184]|nr:MAG: Ribonuclease PH [Lentisphaerae bacterium ADurb.BinA184]